MTTRPRCGPILVLPPAPRRDGLTLVELLIALSILSIGLLAIAGVAAGLLRASAEAGRAARAAELLQARAESLHVAACGVAAAGTRDVDGLRETWTIAAAGDRLVLVDSIAYALPGRPPQGAAIETRRWCEP